MDLTGKTLGQYQILEQIGRGGMAYVYRAVQSSMGRTVAVKVLPAHFLQDQSFLERFNREAKVVSALQHPHILPVYDFGEQDGMPYIVMAYMRGGTVADLIHVEGGLPLEDIVRLVEDIASGLDYAHRRGIIHRDFKPSNILLDEEGQPYLSDFGIAKIAESTMQLTGSAIVGTPAYMAPEMAGPGGVSPLTDIYAMGVTLYQMLTGRAPYEADTPMGVLMAHANKPIPDARRFRPDLPDMVQRVVEKAMAKDPADRYKSARELAAALRDALAQPEPSPSRTAARPIKYVAPPADLETAPEVLSHTPAEPVRREQFRPAGRPPARRRNWLWLLGIGAPILCVAALLVGAAAVGILNGRGLFGLSNPGASVGMLGEPTSTRQPTRTPQPAATALPTTTPMPLPTATDIPVPTEPVSSDLLDTNWTMEGHNASHTSFSAAERSLYPPLDMVWYAEVPSFYADSITVVDGELYLAGMEWDSSLNEVVKLDASGSIEWRYILEGGGGGAMDQTVAYYDGLLFFGGQGDTYLYGLNAYSGTVEWMLDNVGGLYASSPTFYDGSIYAFGDFGIFSVDARTGQENWSISSDGWGGTVAIWGNYAAAASYNASPMGFDAYTGSVLWTRSDIDPTFTDVIAYDGAAYLGADYQIWALDLESGDTLWATPIPIYIEQETAEEYNLALAGDILYASGGNIGSDSGRNEQILFALNARTGEMLWQGQAVPTSFEIAVANGVVYSVQDSGGLQVMALDAYNGEVLWSYYTGSFSSLAVSEDRLYVTQFIDSGVAVLGFE